MLHLTASGRTSGVRCILPHCLRRSPLCFTFWLPFVALRCLSYQQDWPETADLVIKFLLEVKWKVLQVVLGVWDRTGMRCDYFRKRRGIVFVFFMSNSNSHEFIFFFRELRWGQQKIILVYNKVSELQRCNLYRTEQVYPIHLSILVSIWGFNSVVGARVSVKWIKSCHEDPWEMLIYILVVQANSANCCPEC